MSNKCFLCKGTDIFERPGKVRDNGELKILECSTCGLVFLSSFEHIGETFYEQSGMHSGDLELKNWLVETEKDDERRFQFLKTNLENKSVLDFGCGNGGFLIKAKKTARLVAGIEPEARLSGHFNKNELSVAKDIEHLDHGDFDIITMFHVIEHLHEPIQTLKNIAKKLAKNGQIIVETPNANDALLTTYSCQAFSNFTYWSCHLFLYNQHTLSLLAKPAGLKVNFVKQVQRYPLSNHLYWLAKGRPGGHKNYYFIDSDEVNKSYETQLASVGCCDTVMISYSRDE
jgi:2-polyprenyl-3-methyl-5-hydroxy-6-metoxy-1,4-benzoquinol methylase